MKRICIVFLCLCAVVPLCAEELEDARSAHDNNSSVALGLAVGLENDRSAVGVDVVIPFSNMIRFELFVSVYFPAGSGATANMGGTIEASLLMGPRGAGTPLRVYGGPMVVYALGSDLSQDLVAGGKGGVEFISTETFAAFFEFGGGCRLFFTEPLCPGGSVFLRGGLRFFVQ